MRITFGIQKCRHKKVISSPDLVLAVRRQKTGEGGRGRERGKRDLAKYELAHASTAHALNLTCVQSVYRHRVRHCVAFCFKKRGSLNLKPKIQALICFEGCSTAGQHVLAVLPTGYGKFDRSTSSCCQTCRKSECFGVLKWKSRVYHICCLAVIGPGTPDFGFEEE